MAAAAGPAAHLRPALHLGAALIAAAAIVTGAQAAFTRLLAVPSFAATSAGVQETVFTLLLFGALLAVAAAALTLDHGWGRLAGSSPGRLAGIGLAIGVGGLLLSIVLAALAGRTVSVPVAPNAGILAVAGGTLLVLFQAGVEEVYFRGWLQPLLSRSWGNLAGLLVTAAAFAALHMFGGALSFLSIVNLTLGGLLFGLLAQRSGGIVMATAAHFGWNWAEGIGLGLVPNPGAGSFGALYDVDLQGSAAWGGSAEGLNASLPMTLVLVALVLPALAWRWPPAVTAPATPG